MLIKSIEMLEHSPNIISKPLSYQLDRAEVDVTGMVITAQERLMERRKVAVAAGRRSPIWQDSSYPSLTSFPYRRIYSEYGNGKKIDPVDEITGGIKVPSTQVTDSYLGEYFTESRVWRQGDFSLLRGLTYYVSVDRSKDTPDKKLAVMTHDIREGLDMIFSIDRRFLDGGNYLLYLGILDHLKSHALTAFHALTFHERTDSIPEDEDYNAIRKSAQRLMYTVTRAYYQTCIGRKFDSEFNPKWIDANFNEVAKYIATSGHSAEHFTLAEVSDPITILLGVHESTRRKPHPDVIIGIPSGGTEVSVAMGLIYEVLYPDLEAPAVEYVPLSFHYKKQGGIELGELARRLRSSASVEGKRVLIVDDNSNTGSTLQRMVDAANLAGAGEILVHIAEIDPGRLIVKAGKENKADFGTAKVVDMNHPDFETAMGITLASDTDGRDVRTKDIIRFVRKAHRELEKKGKETIF